MLKELRELWDSLPNKLVLVVLLAAWWALFQFYGAAQLHWLPTPSLFTYLGRMLWYAWTVGNDDQLGVLMPLLFLVLVGVRRRELKLTQPVEGRWTGVVVLCLAAAAHAILFSVQQVVLSFQAFLIGAYAMTGIVWGREWLRRFFFPFVVLCFMMPIVHFLDAPTFWLRHFSAATATWVAQNVLNIPLVRQATQVSSVDAKGTINFTFDVIDACSGIRSLKVITLLTVVFGFLHFKTAWRRWMLLVCAPLLAVAGNVIRLVTTFWVGDLFGQYAASKFEPYFGYVTFAVAFGGLILIARGIREQGEPPSSGSSAPIPEPAT